MCGVKVNPPFDPPLYTWGGKDWEYQSLALLNGARVDGINPCFMQWFVDNFNAPFIQRGIGLLFA